MRWRLPKAAVINRSKTNQTSRPKRTGGDWQDGVPAFRGWTIDEGAAEPSSQDRRDGLRGSGPRQAMESLISANQGRRGAIPLADLAG